VDSCKQDNIPSGYVKCGSFLSWLSDSVSPEGLCPVKSVNNFLPTCHAKFHMIFDNGSWVLSLNL